MNVPVFPSTPIGLALSDKSCSGAVIGVFLLGG
jgi:hypothetical protein